MTYVHKCTVCTSKMTLCLLLSCCSFVFLGVHLKHFLLLGSLSVFTPPLGLLDLGSPGLGLVSQHLGTCEVSLLLVDILHEDTLVLEHVTLGLQVQLVVQMAVNLLGLPVSLEQSSQNSHSQHPQSFLASSGICSTLPLTLSSMTSPC